jgi:hypothetical protein
MSQGWAVGGRMPSYSYALIHAPGSPRAHNVIYHIEVIGPLGRRERSELRAACGEARHCFAYIGSTNGPIQRPKPVRAYVQYGCYVL